TRGPDGPTPSSPEPKLCRTLHLPPPEAAGARNRHTASAVASLLIPVVNFHPIRHRLPRPTRPFEKRAAGSTPRHASLRPFLNTRRGPAAAPNSPPTSRLKRNRLLGIRPCLRGDFEGGAAAVLAELAGDTEQVAFA